MPANLEAYLSHFSLFRCCQINCLHNLARLTRTNVQWLAVGTSPMCADTAPDAATPLLALCRDEERLLRCFRRLSENSRSYVLAFAEHHVAAIGVSPGP